MEMLGIAEDRQISNLTKEDSDALSIQDNVTLYDK
jgi:hypothetical protein